jgi:tetratricopeptide (TPR) repeat protein
MTNANTSVLPPVNPEHRRVAAGQFERANQVVATGNYDYGIRLLLSCCKLDPGNLIYRQALRRTEKAKYRNNMRGSMFAWMTTWPIRARIKTALRARDYLKVLEYGERLLTRNPWDIGAQMDMADAAEVLGLLDLAIWNLEQARQKQASDVHLNRALAHLYEKRGNFTQAIALWELVRKVKPGDAEAQQKIKDLAADDTIARGQYGANLPGNQGPAAEPPSESKGRGKKKESTADMPALATSWWAQGAAPTAPGGDPASKPASSDTAEVPFLKDRLEREAAPLRARLKDDPTSSYLYLQLAAVFRRGNELDRARAVLQEGLGPTGNAFELSLELADLDIEPFRRNLSITEEKLKADKENAELRRLRARLRKEINTRELDMHRQKADRYPTEMGHRYEVGVRLLRAGQVDEAIRELQLSRADPRHRWQSLLYLGHCFKARNNWRLAQRNFEESLKSLPAGEATNRKEILYELAVGCAEANDLAHAIDMGHELANIDFSYRDIGRLLDEWHNRMQQANVSN